MTATGRAILGAASGALITLCVHPVSRPFMLGVTSRASPELLSRCVDANAAVLPPPTTVSHASLWMQIAAGKVRKHLLLSEKERKSILGIAGAAEIKERNNAFWPEMEAIIYDQGGQTAQTIDAWNRASTKTNWNDHQTNRLLAARMLIAQVTGVKQAWQLAYLYYSRSDDFAICLERVARTILATAENDTAPGLTLRMATIRNGELLRAHAQSSKTSIMAMNIIDLATYPAARISESNGASPKKLEIGEGKILSNLVKILHRPDWALEAKNLHNIRRLAGIYRPRHKRPTVGISRRRHCPDLVGCQRSVRCRSHGGDYLEHWHAGWVATIARKGDQAVRGGRLSHSPRRCR